MQIVPAHRVRTRFTAAALVAILGSALWAWAAGPASAAPVLPIFWRVDASTHLAKLNRDVTVPRGYFDGGIDLGTGDLTGSLTLPPAKVRLEAVPGLLPLADATFKIEEAQPITGHLDLATMNVTSTAVFNIKVLRVEPLGLPINLVGDKCTTSTPISVTMSGPASLTGASTFTGQYTIPSFKDCGLPTPALTLLMSGSGNTFTGKFSPPPPPVANAGADFTVESGASFVLDGSATTDPENRPLTYQWTQVGGPAAVLTNNDKVKASVVAPRGPATLTFRLTATHAAEHVSDTDDVVVTVQAAPK